jgi:hypothetical protein
MRRSSQFGTRSARASTLLIGVGFQVGIAMLGDIARRSFRGLGGLAGFIDTAARLLLPPKAATQIAQPGSY